MSINALVKRARDKIAAWVVDVKASAMAWLFYADTTPTRSFLIGACIVWGTWVIGVDGFIPEVASLATMYQIFHSANLIASIPLSVAVFQIIVLWRGKALHKSFSLVAGALMSAWWIFTAVSYWRSSPLLPSIGVYVVMSLFGLWVVWRDASPKRLEKIEGVG